MIAGGAAGCRGKSGGGGAGGYKTATGLALSPGTVYTAAIGTGGADAAAGKIQAVYDSGAQTLEKLVISTATADSGTDAGKVEINVDGTMPFVYH